MKKYCITLLSVLYVSLLNAQDVIITKNAEKIEAKIIEVSPTEVKYKKTNNLDGPTFIFYTSDLQTIIYNNGDVQLFDVKEDAKDKKENVVEITPVKSDTEKSEMADILITKKGKKIAVFIEEETTTVVKYRRIDNPNVVLSIPIIDIRRIDYKAFKTNAIYNSIDFKDDFLPPFTCERVWVKGKRNMKKRYRYCGGNMVLTGTEFVNFLTIHCPQSYKYEKQSNAYLIASASTILLPPVSLILLAVSMTKSMKILPTYNTYCASKTVNQ